MFVKIAIVFTLLGCSLGSAITIAGSTPQLNDRFANDPNFIGSQYDFSGVAREISGNQNTWATLIGHCYFISANHFHPADGDLVTFYETNDPNGASHTYTVSGGTRIGNTDLWIGYFDQEVDSSIARYSFSTTVADSLEDTGLVTVASNVTFEDAVAIAQNTDSGITYAGTAATQVAVGQNNFEAFIDDSPVLDLGTFDQIITIEETGELFETQAVANDSGSPIFSIDGGELILQGTASAIGTLETGEDITIYNYVGSYDVLGTIDALDITHIPEPTVVALLSLGGLTLLRRKR